MDDETDWRKQLLVGLGVLVIVALLIGGVVGVIAIKAADVAGIDGSTSTKKDDERVTFPTFTPTNEVSIQVENCPALTEAVTVEKFVHVVP